LARAAKAEPQPAGGSDAERREYDRALARIGSDFPAQTVAMVTTGLRHVVDFQDAAYGHLYLDRLADLLVLDRGKGGSTRDFALTSEAAKCLAKAMAYDDV